MKRILAIILSVIMMVSLILPITSGAADIKEGKCGEDAYWKLDMSTGELTVYGTGATDDFYTIFYIPHGSDVTTDQYESLPNPEFYQYKNSIITITVEEGITEIGSGLFYGLSRCNSAVLPNSLSIIHPGAFSSCHSLENIDVPDSLTRIGHSAFFGCKFSSFDWPDGVTTIEENVFHSCNRLKEFEIPRTVTNIAKMGSGVMPDILFIPNSLNNCTFTIYSGSTEEIIFEDGITEIDIWVRGCYQLKKFVIPKSVTNIRNSIADYSSKFLFSGSEYAGNKVSFDNMGDIELCYTGTDEEWDALLNNIDENIAKQLRGMSVTTNYTYAYSGSNTDPNNKDSSIRDLTGIKEGKCGEDAYWKLDLSTGELTIYGTGATNHFYTEYIEDTKYDSNATYEYNRSLPRPEYFQFKNKIRKITVEEGVTEIGRGLFHELDKCKSATLPNSLSVIHPGCFVSCYEIESINAPESLTRIGNNAFAGCFKLKSFIWPESVAVIEFYVFKGCDSILEFEIPRTVTEINAIGVDMGVKKLFIPQTLDGKIYNVAGTYAEEIIFEEGFTEIDMVFHGFPYLSRVVIPKSVKNINTDFFGSYNSIDFKICYTGTDEEWEELLGNVNEGLATVLRSRLETTNYTYPIEGDKEETTKFETDADNTTSDTRNTVTDTLNSNGRPKDVIASTDISASDEATDDSSAADVTTENNTSEIAKKSANEIVFLRNNQITIIVVIAVVVAVAIIVIIVLSKKKK